MPDFRQIAACASSAPLPPELTRLPPESLRTYGPVITQQCDHVGTPIQRYLTMLVECRGGNWLLRRQVTTLGKDAAAGSEIIEMSIADEDARRWLTDHQVALQGPTDRLPPVRN